MRKGAPCGDGRLFSGPSHEENASLQECRRQRAMPAGHRAERTTLLMLMTRPLAAYDALDAPSTKPTRPESTSCHIGFVRHTGTGSSTEEDCAWRRRENRPRNDPQGSDRRNPSRNPHRRARRPASLEWLRRRSARRGAPPFGYRRRWRKPATWRRHQSPRSHQRRSESTRASTIQGSQ